MFGEHVPRSQTTTMWDTSITWASLLSQAESLMTKETDPPYIESIFTNHLHGRVPRREAYLTHAGECGHLKRLDKQSQCPYPDISVKQDLKRYKYDLLEARIFNQLSGMANGLAEGARGGKPLQLPRIASPTPIKQNVASSTPIKPTELLHRVLEHQKLSSIIVPRAKSNTTSKSDNSSQTNINLKNENRKIIQEAGYELWPIKNIVPRLNYAHQSESHRNLPSQPELLRLLTDPEIRLREHGMGVVEEINPESPTGSVVPPLISNIKDQAMKKRKLLCKLCKMPPGKHQKWCELYEFGELAAVDPATQVKRPQMDLSSVFSKAPKPPPPPPKVKKVRPTYIVPSVDINRPDYRSIHRDVYYCALAKTRTRHILKVSLKRPYDFSKEFTRPFVFSYFDNIEMPSRKKPIKHEMRHIFGKGKTNFTDYYTTMIYEQLRETKKQSEANEKLAGK